jgi:uncharacterized protein (TIGR03083 family)
VDHDAACAALAAEIAPFVTELRGLDRAAWGTPAPACPGWTVLDVVEHLGTIHRWAATMVRECAPTRLNRDGMDMDLPGDPNGYADWFAAGALLLLEALREADGDDPMWAWGADQHVRFWSRRQLHETAVHHADVRLALDLEPALLLDPPTACDGVDELLDNLPAAAYFSPAVQQLRGGGESIHLHATDVDGAQGEWTILLAPDGFSYSHEHGKGSVAVRGTAADLLLLLYNRRSLDDGLDGADRFQLFGERPVLEHWLEHGGLS